MPAKTYLRILQGGLIASLLIVFFVFKDLLFPYITSKQLSFNVLMEFLLAIWLVFVMRFPEYRPKKNLIIYGLMAYFVAIVASCVISVDPILSFWGDSERMLGFFHILHFFIFYLILVTVFKTWKEWQALLFSSIVIAPIVALIGLFGETSYSTIGNTAYVSGYLIFNIFFCVILFLRSEYKGWRWLYALPVIIMLLEFWNCHTSGAIIGLAISILLTVFLLGLFHQNKALRRSSLIVFVLAVAGVIIIFSQSDKAWFQNSFLRNLTSQKVTFQTRLISWKGAAADFKNHRLFGTGFGNYAIIFDKHFDSKFLSYTRTETYFDRAHNNIIDITSTTGLFGLITYLSIFVAALYYLWKKFQANGKRIGLDDEPGRQNLEIIVIVALLAAYFIQNLAVFDSFVTYIGLMMILGFIYWLYFGEESSLAEGGTSRKYLTMNRDWEWVALIILIIGAYIFTSQYNLKPWRMFKGVINGYSYVAQGELSGGVAQYRQTLTGTPLDRDGRGTLINLVTMNPDLLKAVSATEAQDILDYTISLAQKNVDESPLDSLTQMQMAQVLDTAARYYIKDLVKFNYYSALALQAMEKSIEASPKRATVYLTKAQMLLARGEQKEAIETVNYAISLNPEYPEGYCRLAQFYLFLKDQPNSGVTEKDMAEPMTKCAELDGLKDINSGQLLVEAINYFAGEPDYPNALKAAERLATLYDTDAQIWFNLAKLYTISGDTAKAGAAAAKAISLDPALDAGWNSFLDLLSKQALKASSSSLNK
ncbi:MAG: O-antigen ligase family protein [Patescibacteria group bacterium]|jgi:O-antigen ligase/Flp pilus assembly protein TadD